MASHLAQSLPSKLNALQQRLQYAPASARNKRALDPICRALDAWSFKQAIKLCTKALEKSGASTKDASLIKLLRAAAFIRTNRTAEALPSLRSVSKDTSPAGLGDAEVVYLLTFLLPAAGLCKHCFCM